MYTLTGNMISQVLSYFEFPKSSPSTLSELLQYLNSQKSQMLQKISAQNTEFIMTNNATKQVLRFNRIKVKYEKVNQNNYIINQEWGGITDIPNY